MRSITLVVASILAVAAGLLYAASIPAGTGPSVLTLTQIAATAPNYAGQVVVCSNCAKINSTLGAICISTGTSTGAWIIAGSSLTAVTVCQ